MAQDGNIFELALQNGTTLNSHCQLPTETINVKLPPVTAARVEVFEEVPSTHFLPTSKLPELPEAPNRKNYAVSN